MKTRAPLLLISLFLLPAAAALGGDSRDGFYVRLGLGPSWFEEIKQERDGSDFPFLPYGLPERSRYHRLNAEEAGLGEASIGYSFGNQRFELAFAGVQSDLWSDGGAVYYEGAPLVGADSASPSNASESDSPPDVNGSDSPPYVNGSDSPPYGYGGWSSHTYFDDLTIHALTINVYYDFPSKRGRVVPYIGFGAGAAFVDIPGRQHVSWNGPWYDEPGYGDDPAPAEPPHDESGDGDSDNGNGGSDGGGSYGDDPPPTQPGWPVPYYYDRAVDLSGTSFMSAMYGGVEYRIASDVYLGFRLGYVYIGDVEAEADWENRFPFGEFGGGSDIEVSGLNYWSTILTLRLLRL